MPEVNGTFTTSITLNEERKQLPANNISPSNIVLVNLRKELQIKQNALDHVLADLIHVRSEVEIKAQLIAQKDVQIAKLEQTLSKTQTDTSTWEAQLSKGRQIERDLKDTIGRIQTEAEQKEKELTDKLERLHTERITERHRHEQEAVHSAQELALLRSSCAEKDSRIAELQRKVEEAQKAAVVADGRSSAAAESETKIRELQDLVDFFKRNSQENSKLVCDLRERIQRLTMELE